MSILIVLFQRSLFVAMATGLLVFFFVELLEFHEDRNPWESVEAKLNAIR